jgi:hypothetical protein
MVNCQFRVSPAFGTAEWGGFRISTTSNAGRQVGALDVLQLRSRNWGCCHAPMRGANAIWGRMLRLGRNAPILGGALVALLLALGPFTSNPARGDTVEGPGFRHGLWRFDRTLEYPDHRLVARREEVTRCVDPTKGMKGTFASPNVGKCKSAAPQQAGNRYTFHNRCDYLGPVHTEITVHSEDSYTEINSFRDSNDFPKIDKVVAERIGDCNAAEPREVSSRAKSVKTGSVQR